MSPSPPRPTGALAPSARAQAWPARAWALALATALLAACGGGGGGDGGGGGSVATFTADFYPLNVGDRRTWRSTQGTDAGSVRSERVTALGPVGAGQAYTLAAGDGSAAYLSASSAGISSVPGPGADALSAAAGPVDLVRFGLAAGQTVVTLERSFTADVDGDGRADSIDLRVQSTFVGLEAVATAAGSFPGAARVRTVVHSAVRLGGGGTATIELTSDDWYAAGIGPVRSMFSTVTNGGAAETGTEEITAYGVGSRRSEYLAPSLVSGMPAPDAVVGPDVRPTLGFSEPLDALSLDGANGVLLVNAAGQAVTTTRVMAQGGTELSLLPASPLADGRYEVRLGTGITDLANNPLPATVRAFTVDTAGPQLVSSTPADGSDDAALAGPITLSYDEPVFAAAGSAPQFELADLSTDNATGLTGTVQGRNLVVTLATPLQRHRSYVLTLRTLVTDARGNAMAFANGRITFRTDPGPLARPAVLEEGAFVYAVTQGDIDGDGRSDLVYAAQRVGTSDYHIGARLQQADGRYGAPTRLAALAPQGGCYPVNLVVAHADADGRADIALTGCGGPESNWTVLRQTTPGGFEAESPTVQITSYRIGVLDADGDGRAQWVVQDAVAGAARLNVVRRDGAGNWVSVLAVDAGTALIGDFAVADLDGNGRRDLAWLRLLPNNADWELAWALRQGAGFGAVRSLALRTGLSNRPALTLGDLNQDGRADALLLLQYVPPGEVSAVSELQVLRNDGAAGFTPVQTLLLAPAAAVATVGDLDGDGRADVVVAHSALQRVGVLLQAGDGSLQAERLFESGFGYFEGVDALALLDLNADGRRDLVITGSVLLGRPTAGAWPLGDAGAGSARAASALPAPTAPTGSLAARLRRALQR